MESELATQTQYDVDTPSIAQPERERERGEKRSQRDFSRRAQSARGLQ